MDRDILRPRWPFFGSKRFGLSEKIPRVVSHSPVLTVDCLCVALSVNMLFLD